MKFKQSLEILDKILKLLDNIPLGNPALSSLDKSFYIDFSEENDTQDRSCFLVKANEKELVNTYNVFKPGIPLFKLSLKLSLLAPTKKDSYGAVLRSLETK